MLAAALPARAAWEISDPGTSNPSGVAFADPQHGIVTATSSSGFVFGGLEGSPIRWSENGGLDWEGARVPEALDYAFSPCLLPGGRGWCLANRKENQGVALLTTEDFGKSWQLQALPENLKPRAVWFAPPAGETGWLLAAGNQLWSTANGGQDWTAKPLPPDFLSAVSAWQVADAQHLFLVGGHAGKLVVARSGDGGATWNKAELVPQGEGGDLAAISMAPDLHSGWAVGGEGRTIRGAGGWGQRSDPLVLHTTDGGATWKRQKVDVKTRVTCVWAVSDQEAWVGTFGGYALPSYLPASLLHTVDGGQTWADDRPSGCSVRGLFFLDKDHGWAVGGQGGSPMEPARIMYVWQGP